MRFKDSMSAYRDRGVVAHYDQDNSLQDAETSLFDTYLRDGMSILDLGVGAGRTTPFLAPRSSRYVGVDISEAMIDRCRSKFPDRTFRVGDAARLSDILDKSVDLLVFSFNGLGTLPTNQLRHTCLSECARILAKDGAFVFSLHNSGFLITPPFLRGIGPLRASWRLLYAAYKTSMNLPYRLFSSAYWRGAGYVIDPALHGGLPVFVAEPAVVARELEEHGLAVERCLSAPRTDIAWNAMTPWYYYAARHGQASKAS